MATAATYDLTQTSNALEDSARAKIFHWAVAGATLIGFAVALEQHPPRSDLGGIGAWILACLLADLMYVRIGRSITLTMSLPVVLAAALLYPPVTTAIIAFLGLLETDELRGKSSIQRSLFNRSQVALSAASASLMIHVVAPGITEWPLVAVACALGLVADCVVNITLVSISTVLSRRASCKQVLLGFWGAEPGASLGIYASTCLIGPLLAHVYEDWGAWALLTCTAVLVPLRTALVRIQSLGATTELIRVREAEIDSVNESALAGRRDERLTLAGDLHDEVLPALFKVHLMGEVLKQDLASGRLLDLDDDLPELLEATSKAQDAVRRVVGELRTARSAVRDVARTIRSLADQLENDAELSIRLRLCELESGERSALVMVQVAREALVNSSRYSGATLIEVELRDCRDGFAELTIRDDGRGFDLGRVDTARHFGLQLMKERVEATGGRLSVESSPGTGTSVLARIPLTDRPVKNNNPPGRSQEG
jgi:signal transduction histidine kinase